jgi:hypothetical protein
MKPYIPLWHKNENIRLSMKVKHPTYRTEKESFCKISQSAEDGSRRQTSRHKKQWTNSPLHTATELPMQAEQDTI